MHTYRPDYVSTISSLHGEVATLSLLNVEKVILSVTLTLTITILNSSSPPSKPTQISALS